MNKNFLKLIACLCSCSVLLSGCTKASSVDDIPPMSLEEVAGRRLTNLTNDEKESIIFKYVSDRIVVDKDKLIAVEDKDTRSINKLFSNVNEYLKGNKLDILPDAYGNYLLLEFSKTPYEWEQSKVDIVGFDPAARLYFVDVTYKTTSTLKKVIPDSKIPEGMPEKDLYKQKRYNDYISYLNTKYQGNEELAALKLQDFEKAWGSADLIFEEQQGISLLERTKKVVNTSGGIGKLTYSGLVSDSLASRGATMTIRYVLKYKFNLGEETDLQVDSLYLKNYDIDNSEAIISKESSNDVGMEVLEPFIDRLINSYHKAVEESNSIGLYSLFDDYSKLDKYYNIIRDYTYTSIGGYAYKVVGKTGTTVSVQVDRVNQYRAKGTDMSLPTYNETLLFDLVLSNDDTLRIKSVSPIKIVLMGEPLSVIKNVSGISDTIQYSDVSFTNTNREKVEEVIKKFSDIVVKQDINSSEFLDTVDLGVSQVALQRMVDTITSIKANRKVTYLINYNTATNVYVSATVREIFEGDTSNFDTEANIELVNRDGEWRVVDYIRTLNIKTKKTVLDTKGALCINEK